jgi:hypothetical protein
MHQDFVKRELSCRILYCGPESAGKTRSLNAVRHAARETIVAAALEPGLQCEHLELLLRKTGDLSVHLHLYALPARSFDLAQNTLLLLDAIVLVLDGRADRVAANLAYIEYLRAFLAGRNLVLEETPLVFQWGMLDLPGASDLEELDALYNPLHLPAFAASPPSSRNVVAPLKAVTGLVLATLSPSTGVGFTAPQIPRRGDPWRHGRRSRAALGSRERLEVCGHDDASVPARLGLEGRPARAPEALPSGEQRRDQRIDTRRLVTLSAGADQGSGAATRIGCTLNLSQGGMLVELFGADRPEGSVLDVQLALEDHLVNAQARPIRREGGHVALEFHDLSAQACLIIRRILAKAAVPSNGPRAN